MSTDVSETLNVETKRYCCDTLMKGIILHGGYGTRLRPLTHTGPKQLIPVANKPISQHALEDLIEAQIKEIIIVLGNTYPEKVKEHYGDGSKFGAKITYISQGEPKGIAHAIGLCKQHVKNQPFVVYLGDNLIKGGIKDFVKTFKTSKHEAMILLSEVENPQRFGVAKFNKQRKLTALVEKPKQPPSNYALTGIYFLKPTIFKMIKQLKPSWRGELEITEAIQLLLEKGYDIGYQIVKGWWKDTGAPEDILEANRLILDEIKPEIQGKIENHASLQGRVSIGENTTIKHGAIIRGPTIIGNNSAVEKDVYIGPYTSVGNNTTIKRGEIENSIIMDNCHIDIDDRITDSLIGPNSTITSDKNKPKARRFLIGEQSQINL
jgi:glucose-1-phosphate thymidylyltransferase